VDVAKTPREWTAMWKVRVLVYHMTLLRRRQEGTSALVAADILRSCLQFLDLVDQKRDLYELDIAIRWVPVNVRVDDDEPRFRLLILHQTHDCNMVFAKYAIEHVVRLFEVLPLHGHGAELNELLLDELVSDKHPNSSALTYDQPKKKGG
jgi:hypothetical protein